MHLLTLRERQRLPNKPSQPLSQRVIPPLHMICLARLFTNRLVLLARNHRAIRFPKIRVTLGAFVTPRHSPPQSSARFRAAITHDERNDLFGHGAQGNPHPALVFLRVHQRPEFIQFEHTILGRWWGQRIVGFGEFLSFFLIHPVTVWRLTPKVRVRPRRLERSCCASRMVCFSSSL